MHESLYSMAGLLKRTPLMCIHTQHAEAPQEVWQ